MSYDRGGVWSACLAAVIFFLIVPGPAFAQPVSGEAVRLVETFISALNARDGKMLASLYAVAPHILCTDLDILIFNQVSATQVGPDLLLLSQLVQSRASLLEPPGAAVLPGGFVVVFALSWTYRLPSEGEDRTLRVRIDWRVQRQGADYKIVRQSTVDLDEDTVPCG